MIVCKSQLATHDFKFLFDVNINITFVFTMQVHIFCIVREQPGGVDAKERLKQALQKFKILPLTNDRQQMTEEERYLDYGFEHRVTAMKGILKLVLPSTY